ncbi:MAG: cation:dicarboxylase symporter family transporter [Veillonellales bacterium]
MTGAKKGMGLGSKIMLGMILGFIFGYLFPVAGASLKPLGDIFIRMIKMIVVPLIFSALVMGIAGTGDFKKLGRLGVKAAIWFEAATTIALIVGLSFANFFHPGTGVVMGGIDATNAQQMATKSVDFMQTVVNIVPTNIVDGMARGDMLQIVFFSTFFGIAAAAIGGKGEPVVKLAASLAEIMFKFTFYVMNLAPYGVFALCAFTTGKYGLAMLLPLGKLIFSLYFALLLFLTILFVFVAVITKVNIRHLLRVIKEPAILAFTTTTSEAALPVAMQNLEKFGVPKHIVTFVLPTGYTFNLDGGTLYSALTLLFIAQIYHVDYSLGQQIMIMITLMLATKGIACVPGGSFIVVAGTAASLGLPMEGVALLMGVDRILDMARTGCNLIGNCVAAVVVARWEHELPEERLQTGYLASYD